MGLPVEINPLFVSSTGGYQVGRSLRFRSSASAYLNRTPASTTNQKTWTWSAWVKRGSISSAANQTLFATPDPGFDLYFSASTDTLYAEDYSGGYRIQMNTTQVFRDPSSWYHIVYAVDTTQATASNRWKLYINGVQVTAFGTATYPTQNTNLYVNTGSLLHGIGSQPNATPRYYFDGYLAEVNFIDGSALTPSSFGAYDANGVWQPAKYTGTYGTNGFYLPFSNTTSTTTLVQDASGNGNNWTPNNISLTAGTTYDSMQDVPTNNSPTAANFCVLNPLDFQNSNTFSNGNLTVSLQAASASETFGTIGVSSGKWYWEVQTSAGADPMLGVATQAGTLASRYFTGANSVYYYGGSGNKYVAGTGSAYGATYTTTDVIGIALDLSANTITFYKNNVSQGAISLPSGIIGQILVPAFTSGTGTAAQTMNANFGQRPFSYTPPTGFVALNTYNLPTPTIKNGAQYMAATTYTGNGSSQTLTNGGNNTLGTTFQPDFVWQKCRNAAANNFLADSVRGIYKELLSDSTAAEFTSVQYVTSFNSNGFSFGNDTGINTNGNTYIAWQWKAGGTSSSNTSGSITSTVSVNQTAGFSVVTYTGTGANATVGHGLGVAPSMVFVKKRTGTIGSTVSDFTVWHTSLTSGAYYMFLDSTAGQASAPTIWNSTIPTSTVFSVGTNTLSNESTGTFVAYCFAAVSSYSSFGSYVGNGSADGPFVFTNFRPRFVLIKDTAGIADWNINDSSRDTYNQMAATLFADGSSAESTQTAIDFLSNGFKIRGSTGQKNSSGTTYIYAAFAENPFNYSRAR